MRKDYDARIPGDFHVRCDIQRRIAELLFHILHDPRLVEHVNRPVRNKLFQVVGERFPSEVDPLDAGVAGEAIDDGCSVSEGETTINNEAAARPGEDAVRGEVGHVEVGEGGGIGDEQRAEPEVFEDELIGDLLDRGQGEEGFDEEQGGFGGLDMEQGLEGSIPYLLLQVRVDEVASIHGATDAEALDIIAARDLIRHKPSPGALRPGYAIGHDRIGILLPCKPCFAESSPIV